MIEHKHKWPYSQKLLKPRFGVNISSQFYNVCIMKNIFIILIILLITCAVFTNNIFAQVTQEWMKTYIDYSFTDGMRSIGTATDKQGNIYAGGFAQGLNNYFIAIKYNSSGIQQWIGKYYTNNNQQLLGNVMCIDSSGNIYIAGTLIQSMSQEVTIIVKFNTFTGDTLWVRKYIDPINVSSGPFSICVDKSNNVCIGGGSNGYSIILKYSSQGDTLWTRRYQYNGSAIDEVATDDNGNVYAAGYCNGNLPYFNILVMKHSPSGNLLWTRTYLDTLGNASCIAVDSLGNCYVGGGLVHTGGGNWVVLKYDKDGTFKWIKVYPVPINRDAAAKKIKVSRNGTFLVASGSAVYNATDRDYLTIAYNAVTGDTLWNRRYDGPAHLTDEIKSMVQDKYNNIYVTGLSDGGTSTGYDWATIRYSPSGQQQWIMRYNMANGTDIAMGVCLDTNNNVYVSGMAYTSVIYAINTVKYVQYVGINMNNNEEPENYILYQNYPNPFNPTTEISFYLYKRSFVNLSVFNIMGQEIKTLYESNLEKGLHRIGFDGMDFANGLYFCRLICDGNIISTKKLMLIK